MFTRYGILTHGHVPAAFGTRDSLLTCPSSFGYWPIFGLLLKENQRENIGGGSPSHVSRVRPSQEISAALGAQVALSPDRESGKANHFWGPPNNEAKFK